MAVTDKFYFLEILQQGKSLMTVKNSNEVQNKNKKAEINYTTQ